MERVVCEGFRPASEGNCGLTFRVLSARASVDAEIQGRVIPRNTNLVDWKGLNLTPDFPDQLRFPSGLFPCCNVVKIALVAVRYHMDIPNDTVKDTATIYQQ